ncbi:hypothetical protein Taro_029100 [Colocasia esculenta]|uniref:DUF6737 domain-containing protein n=1 Tax=Colocasia esculenta TaxID=4460 RepID=A0A843VKC8_COLES|nr:hypothetical protein [Colocasia esculenta]
MDVFMRGAMAAAPLVFPLCRHLSPSSPLLARLGTLPSADLHSCGQPERRLLSRLPLSSSSSSSSSSASSSLELSSLRHSCRPSSLPRASEGREPLADDSRFLDEDGVVKDMDGYLNYLNLEYDSIWDTKPAWCQPWTILLTGTMVAGCSWLLLHSIIVTAATSSLIGAWWYIFLYAYPKAYEEMIAQRRQDVVSGVEDTFGVRKNQ